MAATIVYSRHYNIGLVGLERLHPFDRRKYGRAWSLVVQRFGKEVFKRRHSPSRPATLHDLESVHPRRHLLGSLRSRTYLARALEIPVLSRVPLWLTNWCVLRPMRWATAGTVLAAREALRGSPVFNLAGGYHHAGPDRGEGFCVYADVGVAVASLRRAGDLGTDDRVLHIDLDAHQGNGVARVFASDPTVFLFDMYNREIYPRDEVARRRVDCPVPMSSGYDDHRYLAALRHELPRFLDAVCGSKKARLAFYNAGTDILDGDPLGLLGVSAEGVLRRDQFVISELVQREVPCVILPSGGYTSESYKLIAATAAWMLETWR